MSSDVPLDPRVQVAVEPPNAPGAAGRDELEAIGTGEDPRSMTELAEIAWLGGRAHARGARLVTVGLAPFGHKELAVHNLPTMLIEGGVRLLKELGTYVLAGGRLEDGDVMQMRADLPCLVGFHDPAPEDPASEEPVRVVFLA